MRAVGGLVSLLAGTVLATMSVLTATHPYEWDPLLADIVDPDAVLSTTFTAGAGLASTLFGVFITRQLRSGWRRALVWMHLLVGGVCIARLIAVLPHYGG
jgi:hypothetical protein